ncbi:MAG: type II toxin-antitoxin system VapC family toxin [Gammaproteobacteria bacterium]|nr:MAG: type II toxin-antitoxin system VapC family toxin [Gammaproteobacteria bacterium]
MGVNFFLLDTHVLLWWLFDDPKLSERAKAAIASPESRVFVSSVSGWEISIKYHLGKLPHVGDLVKELSLYVRRERFEVLPISLEHAIAAGALDGKHKDPFDRMLIAQACSEKLTLISDDKMFKKYKVTLLW